MPAPLARPSNLPAHQYAHNALALLQVATWTASEAAGTLADPAPPVTAEEAMRRRAEAAVIWAVRCISVGGACKAGQCSRGP